MENGFLERDQLDAHSHDLERSSGYVEGIYGGESDI